MRSASIVSTRISRPDDADIVHERRQRAELAVARLEQPQHIGLDRYVGRHCQRSASVSFDGFDDALSGVAILPIVDAHGVTALAQPIVSA